METHRKAWTLGEEFTTVVKGKGNKFWHASRHQSLYEPDRQQVELNYESQDQPKY